MRDRKQLNAINLYLLGVILKQKNCKEEAKEVTSKLIENAQVSIEQEKQAALAELKKNVAELSIGIAESVIKKELSSKKDQLDLVEGILKDVTLN